ncbi:AAA family ATPase [Streptomyces abikoensis]|uniref:AAA family ATPase n=1 Tax=Streptomyces abikoensis TaxID=97398 RepID=UPI0033E9A29D
MAHFPSTPATVQKTDGMLLRVRVANVRSLRDTQEISLVHPEPAAPGVVPVTSAEGTFGVTPIAAVFGANASGKTNLLLALADMRSAVLDSLGKWINLERIPRQPYALDGWNADMHSSYEVDVLIDGVRWTYGYELSDSRIEAEWIYSYPHGRRQVWLDRDTSRHEVFQWPGGRVTNRKLLAECTRDDALVLSVAGASGNPQLAPLFHWFRDNLRLIQPDSATEQRAVQADLYADELAREKLAVLVAAADLGITGISVDPLWPKTVFFLHGTDGAPVRFAWDHESTGTRAAVTLLAQILTALERGEVLLLDGLGNGLHPRLAEELVRIFMDPDANPRGAQLVFTSHTTSLLLHRVVHPAQAWRTERSHAHNATVVVPLLDGTAAEDDRPLMGTPNITPGDVTRQLRALNKPAA